MKRKELSFGCDAFISLLQSCSEAYPLEAMGDLFGFMATKPDKTEFDVSHTACFQIVEARKEDKVIEKASSHFLTVKNYDYLTGEELLGGYHSHPQGLPRLSPADVRFLSLRTQFQVEIVVSLLRTKGQVQWNCTSDGCIVGSLNIQDEPFAVVLAGYHVYKGSIQPLELSSVYVDMIRCLRAWAPKQRVETLGTIMRLVRAKERGQLEARQLLDELEDEVYKRMRKTKLMQICREIEKLIT